MPEDEHEFRDASEEHHEEDGPRGHEDVVPHHEIHARLDRIDERLSEMTVRKEEESRPEPAEIEPPRDPEPEPVKKVDPVRKYGRWRHA